MLLAARLLTLLMLAGAFGVQLTLVLVQISAVRLGFLLRRVHGLAISS